MECMGCVDVLASTGLDPGAGAAGIRAGAYLLIGLGAVALMGVIARFVAPLTREDPRADDGPDRAQSEATTQPAPFEDDNGAIPYPGFDWGLLTDRGAGQGRRAHPEGGP